MNEILGLFTFILILLVLFLADRHARRRRRRILASLERINTMLDQVLQRRKEQP